jgi:GTP-binding protein EngB required for normal cell division
MAAESRRFAAVKELASSFSLAALAPQLKACEKLLSDGAAVNVAVLGKFKAGKSSFLNSLAGNAVLPAGVVPVTTVITELFWAPQESARVKFLDGREEKMALAAAAEYISEEFNPKNSRGAALVEIGLPSLAAYKGARFVDTPGLDSALRHNTETSLEWLPNTGLALIAVSADAPLSEQDLELMARTRRHSPQIVVLLTKADRLTHGELGQVLNFVRRKVKDSLGGEIPVLPFSVKEGFSGLREEFSRQILAPFSANIPASLARILDHKINSLERQCRDYLLAAAAAASKTAGERAELKELARRQKASFETLKKDFKAIYARVAGASRQEIELAVLAHGPALEKELAALVAVKLGGPLNLLEMARAYDAELEVFFSAKTVSVFEAEKSGLEKLGKESAAAFSSLAEDFSARLALEAQKALGIWLPRARLEPEPEELPQPDVKVSQAFDSHLELLWFLIPTRLLKKILIRHFIGKLSFETEKNLTRLSMRLAENMNGRTAKAMNAALDYSGRVQATVERAISSAPEDLPVIEAALKSLPKPVSAAQ